MTRIFLKQSYDLVKRNIISPYFKLLIFYMLSKKNFSLLIVAIIHFGCFDPEKVLSISISTKDATLPDYSNGLAVLKVQGGTAPFVFIWSDIGESDSLRINLSPGEYSVTVIDAIGVRDSLRFNIDSVKGLNILNLEVETTPSSSTGTNDGTARVLVNGGISPYSYFWSNGFTDSIIYNISPGIYDVTVFDNEGNFGSKNFSIQTLNGSFPILTTLPINNISEFSATSGGNTTADGGSPISQRGACWSTNQNPTIADNSTNNGSGVGIFSSSLTNLTPNTIYYVRAYASNGNGIAYGNQVNFTTTTSLPTLVTSNTSNIGFNSATSGGNISADGGSPISQRGVCWSTNQNPTIAENSITNGSGVGIFSSSLTNLTPNTTYFVRAYASNGNGIAYGNQVNFTTTTSLPTLVTTNTSNIGYNSATSGGNITADGGSPISQRGVCWSTNQNPTIADNSTTNGSGVGIFSSSLSNLTPNTTFYVRAYASNGNGIAYGNQRSFITNSPPIYLVDSLNCDNLNGISSIYYGLNGTSASWGVSGGGYSGLCWRAPDPNNTGNLSQVIGFDHFVSMNQTFVNQGFMEFWVNTYNSGFNNLIPKIYVNGNLIGSALIIGGQLPSTYWLKVRTPTIPSGVNNIKVSFDSNYYILKVDEIKFFEY